MTMMRSERHSFWHDNIQLRDVRTKVQRRIDRFLGLSKATKDLLFVRSVASTSELAQVEDLYDALVTRFSRDGQTTRRVLLAILVNGQDHFEGPIMHEHLPGVMVYGQPTAPLSEAGIQSHSAYVKGISVAVDMALSVTEGCHPSAGFGSNHDSLYSQFNGRFSVPSGACLVNQESSLLVPWDGGLHSGFADLMCFEAAGTPLVHLKD